MVSSQNDKLLFVISELHSEAHKKSIVKVSGISMQPFLLSGESILVDHTATDLKFGDIGVFRKDAMTIVHRVLGRRKAGKKIFYRTKGDWLLYMDDPLESNAIMGKVALITRKGKRFSLNHGAPKTYSKVLAFYSLVVVFIGKLFHLLDKGMDFISGGRDRIGSGAQTRFLRGFFLRIARFFHMIFHGIFFPLFHSTDKNEESF